MPTRFLTLSSRIKTIVLSTLILSLVAACGSSKSPAYSKSKTVHWKSSAEDWTDWPYAATDAGRQQVQAARAEIGPLEGTNGVGKTFTHYYKAEIAENSGWTVSGTLRRPRPSNWWNLGIIVQFADVSGLLAHRVILEGDGDALTGFAAHHENKLYLSTYLNIGDYGEILHSPMPALEDFKDGAIVTEWSLCLSCVEGYAEHDRDIRAFAEQSEFLVKLARQSVFSKLYTVSGNSGRDTVVSGLDAIRKEAASMASKIAAFKSGKDDNTLVNAAYTQFYDTEVAPKLLSTQIKKAKCPVGLRGYPIADRKAYWQEYITDVEEYMDCRMRVARKYDFEDYTQAYAGMKAEADDLHSKTFGVEKRSIPSPKTQVASLERDLDRAQEGLETAYSSIDEIAQDRRKAEELRQFEARMLGEGLASFGTAMSEVANNAPVVTADGTLTTYGAQKAPFEQAKRNRELERENIRRESARKLSNTGSNASSSREASAGPVGDQTLYLATSYSEIADCGGTGPFGVLNPDEPPVDCTIVRQKEIFVLGLVEGCELLPEGRAEGSTYPITIYRVDGLTKRAAQKLRDLAAEDLEPPYAAEGSLRVANSVAEDEWTRRKTHKTGVPLYYPTLRLMDAKARTLGCNGVRL